MAHVNARTGSYRLEFLALISISLTNPALISILAC